MSSAIEWTDATWNPVTGCDRVSPGCAHCYALAFAPRLRAMAQARGAGRWQHVRDGGPASGPAFGVTLHREVLNQPFRWRKPRMVFVNSMSDLFHDEVPAGFIAELWGVMACNPQHTFQILTKRPERARRLLNDETWALDAQTCASEWVRQVGRPVDDYDNYCWQPSGGEYERFPALPNVWLGVTIENRRYVHRADVLRETPAAVRFISAEPLLGPLVPHVRNIKRGQHGWNLPGGAKVEHGDGLNLTGIDWLIAGGESGPGHRPIYEEWVRDLRQACADNGTAFFFKQWGGLTSKAGGRLLDGRTHDAMPPLRQPEAATA